LKRIGITLGDPASIGPEIVRAALISGKLPKSAEYVVIGKNADWSLGKPTRETAQAAAGALEQAVWMARSGAIDAVVTGPIHKARMYEVGFKFPGQTEFFAARFGVENFAMLLTGGKITVALVTTHIPLAEVSHVLKKEEVVRVGLLLADFLRARSTHDHQNSTALSSQDSQPQQRAIRIAVTGLNPHAGESGALGREEIEIIAPAIAALNSSLATGRSSLSFCGPFSPDTLFHHVAAGEWDAVLCMYHDQGLIPLKLHAFFEGVNVTLGLPFPRTSPDHGTAFEIAGKGVARPDSMIAAIQLAVALAENKS
jgi:4-hydroxythreonine-4-phosphate dehydrogenase